MTSKKQKRKERAKIRLIQKLHSDPYRKKDLTSEDITFNNRYTTLKTTMDIKKFIKDHVVWCPKCNSIFTSMIMHAKTSDNKKLKADCIAECKKIWSKKK